MAAKFPSQEASSAHSSDENSSLQNASALNSNNSEEEADEVMQSIHSALYQRICPKCVYEEVTIALNKPEPPIMSSQERKTFLDRWMCYEHPFAMLDLFERSRNLFEKLMEIEEYRRRMKTKLEEKEKELELEWDKIIKEEGFQPTRGNLMLRRLDRAKQGSIDVTRLKK